MRKLSLFLLLFLFSCHYSPNKRINDRVPPVVIISIDKDNSSVVLRDGENKVFTIYENETTNAISVSLMIGDTIRIVESKIVIGDF